MSDGDAVRIRSRGRNIAERGEEYSRRGDADRGDAQDASRDRPQVGRPSVFGGSGSAFPARYGGTVTHFNPRTACRYLRALLALHASRQGSGNSLSSAPMYEGLPGAELIEEGLQDLSRGRESVPALLVSIGAPRLRRCGVPVENPILSPEHRLYRILQDSQPDSAHSRYNALVRRLVSFERALECAS